MRFFKLAFLALAAAACAALFAMSAAKPCFEEGESYTFFCGNTSADCRVVTVKDGAALSLLAGLAGLAAARALLLLCVRRRL